MIQRARAKTTLGLLRQYHDFSAVLSRLVGATATTIHFTCFLNVNSKWQRGAMRPQENKLGGRHATVMAYGWYLFAW